jgi:hypothetical protein
MEQFLLITHIQIILYGLTDTAIRKDWFKWEIRFFPQNMDQTLMTKSTLLKKLMYALLRLVPLPA